MDYRKALEMLRKKTLCQRLGAPHRECGPRHNEVVGIVPGFESHTNQGNPFYGVCSVSGLAHNLVAVEASVRI